MLWLLATSLSILAICALAWGTKKLLGAAICPICIGVAGTWLWMLVARALGYPVDALMLAILLGGSVSAIAFQIERQLPPGRSALLWKTLSIPAGFALAYGLAAMQWALVAAMSAALALLTLAFLAAPAAPANANQTVEELKRKMSGCC